MDLRDPSVTTPALEWRCPKERGGGAGSRTCSPLSATSPATDIAVGLSAPEPDPKPTVLSLPPPPPPVSALPTPAVSSPALPEPIRAWLGVSRASRFLVLRKEELGVGVGQQQQRRQQTGGQTERDAERGGPEVCATETHGLVKRSSSEEEEEEEVEEEVVRVGLSDPGSVEVAQVGGDASGQVPHSQPPVLRCMTSADH
ncbi:hypothetical protein JOB18_006657 [Solea senegalensis]|uniref:Uncharacterized protein n=1 Tax=Solea senegalensis TaxID=28829 RepID=A0AAV6PNT6_SOLSE|nr:hypothetical protein JOB18_006657 [Solea senegalensis]